MEMRNLEWFEKAIEIYPSPESEKFHNPLLIEFKDELKKLPIDIRRDYVKKLQFSPMFDLVIIWNNPIFAKPFYELLAMIIEVMKASEAISTFSPYLKQFMSHVDSKFKYMIVALLQQAAEDDDLECLLTNQQILAEAANLVGMDEMEDANPAIKLLSTLALNIPAGTKLVFSGPVQSVLRQLVDNDSVASFRIYELVMEVACKDSAGLDVIRSTKLLMDLEEKLFGNMSHVDQLGFANAVQAYGQLSLTEHGLQYLIECGVLARLEERVVNYGPGTMEDKVMPTLYTFFGDLVAKFPEKVFKEVPLAIPTIIKLVCTQIDRYYVTQAALMILAPLSTTPAGMRYMGEHSDIVGPALDYAKDILHTGSGENKMCSLELACSLIKLEEADQNEELLALTKKWFTAIFVSVKDLQEMCNQPYPHVIISSIKVFVDERESIMQLGLKLMAIMTELPWGRVNLVESPGFLEWLMDRLAAPGSHPSGTGASPEVLRGKYEVLKALYKGKDSSSLIPEEMKPKIEAFLKEGPIFIRGQYDIAMEGAE